MSSNGDMLAPVSGTRSRTDSGVDVKSVNSDPDPPLQKLEKTMSWLMRNKLSQEFDNAKDEAELGNMMGDDGEKLLNLVDDIRKIDKLRPFQLDIPQIVVVGDTSTGKSSVLQALTRLPFPVASDLCTRFITETTIRRCSPSERPGYTIEVKMENTGASQQDEPFSPKSFDHFEWPEVYRNLKGDIADSFDKMSPEHLRATAASTDISPPRSRNRSAGSRSSPVPQLLKHRLLITVRKPEQAHFSIVDIPGLISNGAQADIRLSEELARNYINNKEAVVLAITPADNVLVNQKCLNLVAQAKALDRTIGVITRCDRIENKNEGKIFELLRNNVGSEDYLKLGWFAVRNRSPAEVSDEESFDERDKKEKELFASGKWEEALTSFPTSQSIRADVLGTPCLKRMLQQHLYKRVKESFPDLRSKMRALETQYQTELRNLGEPRDNRRDQQVYLSNIQAFYETEVERSLNGDYRLSHDDNKDARLRQHVKTFNDKFEADMQCKAIKYQWQLNDNDEGSDENGILHWIEKTWDEHRGSEARFDAPRSLKKALVMQQTESWESTTQEYILNVEDKINKCNDNIFEFTCKDEKLRHLIRDRLREREMKSFQAARDELQRILKDREFIDSWNPLFRIFIQESQHPRMKRQVESAKRANTGAALDSENEMLTAREKFYYANKTVYENHDWLLAYWKVAYPRFVDNVIIQVVERHLLGSNGPLKLFNRNWIFDLGDEELEELAGESEKTRNERRELKERLEGLRDALKKADNALR